MSKLIWIGVLLTLVGNSFAVEKPDAINLSKQIIVRETTQLTEDIQHTKRFMARARLTSGHASQLNHSIARKESLVVVYGLILKSDHATLRVATAKSIVNGDLERLYEAQEKFRRSSGKEGKNDPDRVKSLLSELKTLNEWQNK